MTNLNAENQMVTNQEHFRQEYERQLKNLKREFQDQIEWQKYCVESNADNLVKHIKLKQLESDFAIKIEQLRSFVAHNFCYFNANEISSILAIPSQMLSSDELVFHRIWLGSHLPQLAFESINQWEQAFEVTQHDLGLKYHSVVWVWDVGQVDGDQNFIASELNDSYLIGYYLANTQRRALVKSLKRLLENHPEIDAEFMQQLINKRYFVDVSDYFREFILYTFGGIYIDVDTVPYRAATAFLAKPEVPDYYSYLPSATSGEIEQIHVSWLNLLEDENGMQIAKKGNTALAKIIARMNANISRLDKEIPDKDDVERSRAYQLYLHDSTYGEWYSEIGRSFIAYDNIIAKNYLLVLSKIPETVVLGLYGMRLIYDPVNNVKLPLTDFEEDCYRNCIRKLESCNWNLTNPLQLQSVAPVIFTDELIRIAYHPQLRTADHSYDYYSFMSHDENLDRVNNLFGAFFIALNAESIHHPYYWVRLNGASSRYYRELPFVLPICEQIERQREHNLLRKSILPNGIRYIRGDGLTEQHKNQIAELLFETSYLEYCSYGNKLQLPKVQLQRLQNVDPMADYCNALIDIQGQLLGFFIGLKVSELNQIQFVSYYRGEMKDMDAAYDVFITKNTRDNDYFVGSLAIDKKFRGLKYFNAMFNEIVKQARESGAQRIVLTVWESSPALALYLKKGFRKIGDSFDYAYPIFFDKLYMLEYTNLY